MQQPEPTILAYLAGVIDSDGYITVHKSTRGGIDYYAARVGIAGTRRQPHDLAASIWGVERSAATSPGIPVTASSISGRGRETRRWWSSPR